MQALYLNVTSIYDNIPPVINSIDFYTHQVDTRHGDANFTVTANITELGGSGIVYSLRCKFKS